MKRSKRYIKKKQKRELINKKVLKYIVDNSNICKHSIKELQLAGYCRDKIGMIMYKQVIEVIAVLSSHVDTDFSASWKLNIIKRLYSFDVLSPLKFTDDEWGMISTDGTYQNKRKSSVFKNPDGNILYIDAFTKLPIYNYNHLSKKLNKNKSSFYYKGGLFESKNEVFTGRYFSECYLLDRDVNIGWLPIDTKVIECIEIDVDKNNYIMIVDADNDELHSLSNEYNIQWKNCSCIKGINYKDITLELVEKAYKEINNNK